MISPAITSQTLVISGLFASRGRERRSTESAKPINTMKTIDLIKQLADSTSGDLYYSNGSIAIFVNSTPDAPDVPTLDQFLAEYDQEEEASTEAINWECYRECYQLLGKECGPLAYGLKLDGQTLVAWTDDPDDLLYYVKEDDLSEDQKRDLAILRDGPFYPIEVEFVGLSDCMEEPRKYVIVQDRPGRTNSSHEERTKGWLGTNNDWHYQSKGECDDMEDVRFGFHPDNWEEIDPDDDQFYLYGSGDDGAVVVAVFVPIEEEEDED